MAESTEHSRAKGVFSFLGISLLVLGGAYYAWSSDVANASRLPSGKGVEIRVTSGSVHIFGTEEPGRQNGDVRVTIENVSDESAQTAHIKIDRSRNPVRVEISGLPHFATAMVEVPRSSSLAVSMLAGDLQIQDVDGDKRCLLRSGKMVINVGDPDAYKSAHAFVLTGAIQAPAFNSDKGGLWRRMTWKGPGRALINAHVGAGVVVLQ